MLKSIVEIYASQLYSFSMRQDTPTGLYTRSEFDADMQKFKASHKTVHATMKIWSCLYTRNKDQNAKL